MRAGGEGRADHRLCLLGRHGQGAVWTQWRDGGLPGYGVGSALLLRTLAYMRDEGYAYAVIGWVTDVAPFYEKLLGATFIPGGEPQHRVYSQLVKAYW